MTPQPFTPAGVAAMQAELNALPAADLEVQANAMRSDLRTWVSDNFTLTTDQSTYLTGMDSRFFDYAGPVTAFAILNGRPITVNFPAGPPTTFKLIHVSDDMVVTNSPDGFSATGGVTFSIIYE
ncbi:MAG: hypothetical protein JST19_07775 [Bacteroidetes bacterium]|nr:hypothetical protein [Bacteroidota bacterium]